MHIYVHVPFCARRCSYCDFAIAVRRTTPDAAFLDAVGREWTQLGVTNSGGASATVTTLYFGGGTPSRLDPSSIEQLIDMVRAGRPVAPDAEVTLETNPDDVTPSRALAWAAAGVNRVSLGVQSHDQAVLDWMHRTHCAAQVPDAVRALKDAGIDNISIDLIFALPAALHRDWEQDLDRTFALRPSHVSLYGLTVEPHTPLFQWIRRGTASVPPEDRYAEEYLRAGAMLAAAGFEHYEVSNACLPGFRSRHNSAYWTGVDYLGIGPSAHSFESGVRRWNVREWADYRERLVAGVSVVAEREVLGPEARALERRYLRLRTDDGLPVADLPGGTADAWTNAGWAVVSGAVIRLTREGWLRLDALVGAARHS